MDRITKLDPMFSKTLVLVKPRVLKYRPSLNNRTSISQIPGSILQTYPKHWVLRRTLRHLTVKNFDRHNSKN